MEISKLSNTAYLCTFGAKNKGFKNKTTSRSKSCNDVRLLEASLALLALLALSSCKQSNTPSLQNLYTPHGTYHGSVIHSDDHDSCAVNADESDDYDDEYFEEYAADDYDNVVQTDLKPYLPDFYGENITDSFSESEDEPKDSPSLPDESAIWWYPNNFVNNYSAFMKNNVPIYDADSIAQLSRDELIELKIESQNKLLLCQSVESEAESFINDIKNSQDANLEDYRRANNYAKMQNEALMRKDKFVSQLKLIDKQLAKLEG